MSEINLLPDNLIPDKKFLEVIWKLNTVNLVGTIVLMIASILMGAIIVTDQRYLSGLSGQKDSLNAEIKSLEVTEKQYYFVKDRLSQAIQIINKSDAGSNLTSFEPIFKAFPMLDFDKASFSAEQIELTANFTDLTSLSEFLTVTKNINNYRGLAVRALRYEKGGLYKLSVALEK